MSDEAKLEEVDAETEIKRRADLAHEALERSLKNDNEIDAAFFRGRYCGLVEALDLARGSTILLESGNVRVTPLATRRTDTNAVALEALREALDELICMRDDVSIAGEEYLRLVRLISRIDVILSGSPDHSEAVKGLVRAARSVEMRCPHEKPDEDVCEFNRGTQNWRDPRPDYQVGEILRKALAPFNEVK